MEKKYDVNIITCSAGEQKEMTVSEIVDYLQKHMIEEMKIKEIRQYDDYDLKTKIINDLMKKDTFDTDEIELAKLVLKD